MTQGSNVHVIYGPPGTGKTTRLLDILEQEIKNGIEPNRIAFCSFTKKATEEAIDRVVDRFTFNRHDMIFFRTIHALAFQAAGLKRQHVMQHGDYQKIGDHLGLTFGNTQDFEGLQFTGKHAGSQYMFIDGFSRARCITPKQVWELINPEGLNWFEFLRYCDTVKQYKEMKGLVDFSDMLTMSNKPLPVDVLIIDEAQDLSTAQWEYLKPTIQSAKRVYIGGDDDQAIFSWGGADVNYFINVRGKKEVLVQSHRIPAAVHQLSNDITTKIKHRKKKEYAPKSFKGEVNYWASADHVDIGSGSWLLLARNNYLLNELVTVARNKGVSYSVRGKATVAGEHVQAIKLWERWRKKDVWVLEDHEQELLEKFLPENCEKWPKDKIWHDAFTRMHVDDREYYISLLRRGESLTKKPRVNITTIHGSKGGEADNVLLLTDVAFTTWDAIRYDEDSEHRVWYVGATRAKENLHIILPRGKYFYQI